MCLPNNAAELVEFATLAAPSTNLKIVKLGKFDELCCEGRRKEGSACMRSCDVRVRKYGRIGEENILKNDMNEGQCAVENDLFL